MNLDECHDEHQHSDEEHSNILMFISWITQQHSDGQNVYPNFQVKVSGTHDTWHNIIGHPPTATRAQKLYK